MGKWTASVLNALLITLLSVVLSKLVIYELTSINTLAPASKVSDWRLTDIYNTVAADRLNVPGDPDVVVIDIDTASRRTISSLINAVNFCSPKAVGLDVIFKYPSDDGLAEAIQACENIVLPRNLQYDGLSHSFSERYDSFFYDNLTDKEFGAVNFIANDVYDVVREFRPFFNVGERTVDNFSSALVRLACPEKYEILTRRGNETEIIYYPSADFSVFGIPDVLDEEGFCRIEVMDDLEGKIVLIGDMHNKSDMFLTPIGDSVPGIEIHARTVSTILYERYISHTSVFVDWAIALLCCFLLALAGQLRERVTGFKDTLSFLVRILQITILYVFILIGARRFIEHNQYMDFSVSLMMVGLCALATDVYKGLAEIVNFIYTRIRQGKSIKNS